jgi:hypothetical protein
MFAFSSLRPKSSSKVLHNATGHKYDQLIPVQPEVRLIPVKSASHTLKICYFVDQDSGCPRGHKREAGVSPAWSRHCNQENWFSLRNSNSFGEGREPEAVNTRSTCKSGDQPGIGCDSTPRGNGRDRLLILSLIASFPLSLRCLCSVLNQF